MYGRAPRQDGFTLSEILVALALMGLLMVMLLGGAQLHVGLERREAEGQQMQDNARAALEEIVQASRRAGAAFSSRQVLSAVPPGPAVTLRAVDVTTNCPGAAGGDGPDCLSLILSDDSNIGTLLLSATAMASVFHVDNAAGLRSGSYFTVTNLEQAALYRLLQDPASVTLAGSVSAFDLVVTAPSTPPPLDLRAGAIVVPAAPLQYRIDTTILAGQPMLVLQEGAPLSTAAPFQIVAENIEDLQIAIGVDGLLTGLRDGVLAEVALAPGDDEWVFNQLGEVLPAALPAGSAITALRITLISRTGSPGTLGPGRPAVEDRPAGPADGFRRRVLTTQVSLRSMLSN